MSLLHVSSPHIHGNSSVESVMKQVLLATIPGVLVMTYFFGARPDQHPSGWRNGAGL